MDITTLAAWGEFLGGIAVVVSLIYLASQIRQNSKLLRTSGGTAASRPFSYSIACPRRSDRDERSRCQRELRTDRVSR
jgi:hypothetical protein